MIMYTFFIVTAALALATYTVRRIVISHAFVFIYITLLIVLGFYLVPLVDQPLNDFFGSDRLGLIFYFVLIIVSFVSAIHYIKFVSDRNVNAAFVALHNAGTIFFTG